MANTIPQIAATNQHFLELEAAMAKAVFSKEFRWRRPKVNLAFWIYPSDDPQTFPRDVVDAAIEAGCAEIVPPKRNVKAKGPNKGK